MNNAEAKIYGLIGVGFGPSNLALAAALHEQGPASLGTKGPTLFLEQKEEFAWHPGMMLPGARVQLSFLKDLVTLRNPCSRFSFLCYLQHKKRLDRFINRRTFFPTRQEFNDYYRWVAGELRDYVRYGARVRAIRPGRAGASGTVPLLEVELEDRATGEWARLLTRNVVLALGGQPVLPPGVQLSPDGRVFHAQDFLEAVPARFPDRQAPHRFVVVGSGQTAAEVFQYLLHQYPQATVTLAFRRLALKPADDSHFVNEIFFPEMVDRFYGLSPARRRMLLAMHLDTNYSAVDTDLIAELYEELYEQEVAGRQRGRILNLCELLSLEEGPEGVTTRLRGGFEEQEQRLQSDAVILATGFERCQRPALLEELRPYLLLDETGAYRVLRNFRVDARPELVPGVFLQGSNERTHGLSDTLLSTLAVRSAEILQAVATAEPAFAAALQEP